MKNYILIICCLIAFSSLAQMNRKVGSGIERPGFQARYNTLYSFPSSKKVQQKLDSTINYSFEAENTISYDWKQKFHYNNLGNLISDTLYRTTNEGQLVLDYHCKIKYDDNKHMVSFIDNKWDESFKKWITYKKEEDIFNENGDLILRISSDWDSISNQWVNKSKQVNAYSNYNQITQVVKYYWNLSSKEWINNEKTENSYDSNGNIIQNISCTWNNSTKQWINNDKDVYTYDDNYNKEQSVDFYWDIKTNQWTMDYKYEYSYDEKNILIRFTNYDWDSEKGLWNIDKKYESNYDSNGKLIQMTHFYWNIQLNQWISKRKIEYNHHVSLDENPVLPFCFFEDKEGVDIDVRASSIEYKWIEEYGFWEMESKRDLHFSEFFGTSSSSEPLNRNQITLFPNPTTDYIRIKSTIDLYDLMVQLYDMNGRMLVQKKAASIINISHLERGTYFVQIMKSKETLITKKIIVI